MLVAAARVGIERNVRRIWCGVGSLELEKDPKLFLTLQAGTKNRFDKKTEKG